LILSFCNNICLILQFPAGLSQSVFAGLVKHWGAGGLDSHVKKVGVYIVRFEEFRF
jgi:hypothetical protein